MRCTSSQWEMALRSNAVSHWLGAYTQWSVHTVKQSALESTRKCLIYIFGALRCRHMSVKMSQFDWLSNNLFRLAKTKTHQSSALLTLSVSRVYRWPLDSPQNVVSNAERVFMPWHRHGKRTTVVNKSARHGQSLYCWCLRLQIGISCVKSPLLCYGIYCQNGNMYNCNVDI